MSDFHQDYHKNKAKGALKISKGNKKRNKKQRARCSASSEGDDSLEICSYHKSKEDEVNQTWKLAKMVLMQGQDKEVYCP